MAIRHDGGQGGERIRAGTATAQAPQSPLLVRFVTVWPPHGPLMSPHAVPSGAGFTVQLKSPATAATVHALVGVQGPLRPLQAASPSVVAQQTHRIAR